LLELTTLCENTAGEPGLTAEWGWSILVQTEDKRILLDTGRSDICLKNAAKLGVCLQDIDAIVLSHSHADHTGGLREVLANTRQTVIFGHTDLWVERYKKDQESGRLIYNGIPFVKAEVQKNARLQLSTAAQQLSSNVMTSGEIVREALFETIEERYVIKEGKEIKADVFSDDLALFCKTKSGLVLILGCAHRGLINTILQARRITGETTIHMIVGGTHLYSKSKDQVSQTIRELKQLGVQNIGVSHCTGFEASEQLAEAFGNNFFINNAGSTHTLR
jgi:7,8-dihydropterin-6-yl-methyl-4-(beta-D-ribofuranosyl)aminobenzene 5'-phosphate synthase